jgi:hypothetical protein
MAEMLLLRDRLHKLQEHSRALEAMVEGLEHETERLRRQAAAAASAEDTAGSDEDENSRLKLPSLVVTPAGARVRPKSVQEEVANVDIVRYSHKFSWNTLVHRNLCVSVLYLIMFTQLKESLSYRLGKLCRRCLGPMDEFTPAALLNEAASQIGETFKSEVSLNGLFKGLFLSSGWLGKSCMT